jgi:hypothetical protein
MLITENFVATRLAAPKDPSHGTLTLTVTGGFVYTPNAGYVGLDSFTYSVSDGALSSGPVAVALAVTNAAPLALDDLHELTHDLPGAATVDVGVLANDSDADGDPLTLTLVSGVSHGTPTPPSRSDSSSARSGFTPTRWSLIPTPADVPSRRHGQVIG